jgi:probable rRNA maturation factor
MLYIKNLTTAKVDEKVLHRVAKILFKGENIEIEKEISLVLVNDREIKNLNKEYRGKNEPTDVLSFMNASGPLLHYSSLGEIVICPKVVKKNAEEDKSNFKKELVFVFIHGILHLLGYEHEKNKTDAEKMKAKENFYLSKIFS